MDWLTTFDPSPEWYPWALHSITAISTPFFSIGLCCIFKVNAKATNKIYKWLLASNLTLTYLTQLLLTIGTEPIYVYPMCGGFAAGLFTSVFNVSLCAQMQILFGFLIYTGITTVLLFYYRQRAILPLPSWFSVLFFVLTIGAGGIAPIVLGYIFCISTDFINHKHVYIKKYPSLCNQVPNYWNDSTMFLTGEYDSFYMYGLAYYGFIAGMAIVWIIIAVYRLTFLLKKQLHSEHTLKMHKVLVKCLLAQTAAHYSLYFLPICVLITVCFFEFNVPGLGPVTFVVLSLSDLGGSIAMIIAHTDYRRAVVRFVFKGRAAGSSLSGVSVTGKISTAWNP